MRTRYTQAEEYRQKALDYITANPGALAPDIAAAIKLHKSTSADMLREMAEAGEVERAPITTRRVNSRGVNAALRTYAYRALVTKTRTAAEVIALVSKNVNRKPEPKPEPQPWRTGTYNADPNRKPIRNQRAQGAVRRRAWIGSSLA